MKFKSLNADVDVEIHHPKSIPEKSLLAAILERAVKDLGSISGHYERQKAIEWFTAKNSEGSKFTFRDVINHLELSTQEVNKIKDLLQQGKELNSNSKRKYSQY